jgi:hypothetical protein
MAGLARRMKRRAVVAARVFVDRDPKEGRRVVERHASSFHPAAGTDPIAVHWAMAPPATMPTSAAPAALSIRMSDTPFPLKSPVPTTL